MPQGQSPVGVLFIHGIGTQRKGETLASFGGALYRWLELAKFRGGDDRVGHVQLEDARLVVPEDPSAPAHARLRLNPGDPQGRDTEWLLAESWWAESFGAPSFTSLAQWGLGIIPWTIGSHFGAHVQAVWSARPDAAGGLKRLAWILRLVRSTTALVASLFFSLAAWIAFAGMLVIALVPIAKVRQWLAGVQRATAASLGDSFTFVVRPLEAAAIVGQVRRDLAWLSTRCDTLVVVAHSQGAAVGVEALRGFRPDNLRLLLTLGSGLRKLEELKEIVSHGGQFKRAAALTLVGAMLTPVAGLALVRWATGGLDLSDPSAPLIFASEFAIGAALLVGGLLDFVDGTARDAARGAGQALKGFRWIDCYSTSDPVPNGKTFDVQPDMPASNETVPQQFSIEVCNQRSVASDHTSYWSNLDEFVSIVGASLASAGAPGIAVGKDEQDWLKAIRKRRRRRVSFLVATRWIAAAGLVATFIRDRVQWWALVTWAAGAVGRWAGIVDAAAAQAARPAAGNALGFTALIIASYSFARLAWGRWDDIEMRDVVGHFEPDGGAIVLLSAIALQILVSLGIAIRSSTFVTTASVILLIGVSFLVPFLPSLTPGLPASRRPRPADSGRRSNTDLTIALMKVVGISIVALFALFQVMLNMLNGLRRLVGWILPEHSSTSEKAVLIGVGTIVGLMLLSALTNFVNWLRRPRVR
jgi:hypothetical protein